MRRLTIEQKVGQLIMAGFSGSVTPAILEDFRQHHFGGLLLVQSNGNAQGAAQTTTLINTLQTAMPNDPPLLVATDQEGGTVCLLWSAITCFPSARRFGTLPPAAAARAEQDVDQELTAEGFNIHLAPVSDVWDGVHPFMQDRSYGEAPANVAAHVQAIIAAGHAAHMIMTAKHFPGHGGASANSHLVLPIVAHSLAQLNQIDLVPFRAAIAANVDVVMMGHLLVPAIDPLHPASISAAAHVLLRQGLGFHGVIMSDDLDMGAITHSMTPSAAAVDAVRDGTDIVIVSRGPAEKDAVYHALLSAVQQGRISHAQLDDAVRRILALKLRYGLASLRVHNPAQAAAIAGSAAHKKDAAAYAGG